MPVTVSIAELADSAPKVLSLRFFATLLLLLLIVRQYRVAHKSVGFTLYVPVLLKLAGLTLSLLLTVGEPCRSRFLEWDTVPSHCSASGAAHSPSCGRHKRCL